MKTEVTSEQIHSFLNGHNPQEKIIKIEGNYNSPTMAVIYRDDNGKKMVSHENFYPFCWAKQSACQRLFGGDRAKIKTKLREYGIGCKALRIANSEGVAPKRMENGYRVMFQSNVPMPFKRFLEFFKEGGRPIYPKDTDANNGLKEYIVVSPIEQFMIQTGKRQFKGYDDYDELLRMEFDLETEGLDPTKDRISQIGISTNRGYKKVLKVLGEGEEKEQNEMIAIRDFFNIVREINPDVLTGHNIENFDLWFIDIRLQMKGSSLKTFTEEIFPHGGMYKSKKQKVLKLGGETEYYYPTIMWGVHITDSLFAVRRAQALNSNIKKADLKYITKFAKLNKPNRVYVPGKIINQTWEDTTYSYAHNDENGKWFHIDEEVENKSYIDENNESHLKYTIDRDGKTVTNNKTGEKFNIVTGQYIVERYLLDDLYETDKVELSFNQTNYQVTKLLPVSFDKMTTMGTAAVWKYIMCAWSYENGLAIPELIDRYSFTGGLSRLLVTGYVDNILKLDYNSLYPSIILSHKINTDIDIMGAMSSMLEYILTKREEYKGEKKKADKEVRRLQELIDKTTDEKELEELIKQQDKAKSRLTLYDNMQSAVKVLGNGFFGSYGSGPIFPFSDLICAEETTCTGRMALRLMIWWFSNIGDNFNMSEEYNYRPLVGDSFTGDTPLFIRYDHNSHIDIKTIEELINEKEIQVDVLGREYDYSKKNFKVLCRSGWVEPSYIYRHKTDKDIYRVDDKKSVVDVTEDHSLFNDKQEKITPKDIKSETKLEKYTNDIHTNIYSINDHIINNLVNITAKYPIEIPLKILNSDKKTRSIFVSKLKTILGDDISIEKYSKKFVAGYNFLTK